MTPQPTNPSPNQQIASLLAKVDSLTTSIDKLASRFDTFSCNLADFRELYLVEHQKLVSEVASHDKDIKSLGERLTALQTGVDRELGDITKKLGVMSDDLIKLQLKVAPIIKLLIIVGGLLLSSVFLLLWDLLTGKIAIGF